MNRTAPRDLPRTIWFLGIALLSAAIALIQLADMPVLADRVSAGISALLLLGMLAAIALPAKRLGYRLVALVLRLVCAFYLMLLGLLGLALLALVVIACMSIVPVPMALAVFAAMLLAAAALSCLCLFATSAADCLNEIAVSARAGAWQTYAGFKCPLKLLSRVSALVFAVLAMAALLCALGQTSAAALFDRAAALAYDAVPSAARTLVRTLAERLRPMLNVSAGDVALPALQALRCLMAGLMYGEYLRMNAN